MRVSIVVLAIGVVPWLAGCGTAPVQSDVAASSSAEARPKSTKADRDDALQKLQKGMTEDEVRVLWGEPVKVAPMEAPTGRAEVWTYRFSYAGPVREVPTSEMTYTRQNPITGMDEVIREPVYSLEQTVIEQTVNLLFYEGRLTEWKQSRESTRKYTD